MAAYVSSLVRMKEDVEAKRELITRDLLGDPVAGSTAERDRPADGCVRRFNLLRSYSVPASHQLQDLNLPPPEYSAAALDLKLVASAPSVDHRSVCTLEKVKLALERAERESRTKRPSQRANCSSPSPSSSTTSTSASVKKRGGGSTLVEEEEGAAEISGGRMVVAGCPRCLLYVLIAKSDPRCPQCDSHVAAPAIKKKARIDNNVENLI